MIDLLFLKILNYVTPQVLCICSYQFLARLAPFLVLQVSFSKCPQRPALTIHFKALPYYAVITSTFLFRHSTDLFFGNNLGICIRSKICELGTLIILLSTVLPVGTWMFNQHRFNKCTNLFLLALAVSLRFVFLPP